MTEPFRPGDMFLSRFDFVVAKFGRPKYKRSAESRLLKVREIHEFEVGSSLTWSWRTRKSFQRNPEFLRTEFVRNLSDGEFSARRNFKSSDGHHFLQVTVHPFHSEGDARLAAPVVRMTLHFHDDWRFTMKSSKSPDVIEVRNHFPIAIEEIEGVSEGEPRLTRFCVIVVSRFVLIVALASMRELSSITSFESILKKQVEKLIRLSEEDSR